MAKDTALTPKRRITTPAVRNTLLKTPKTATKGSTVRPSPSVKLYRGSNDDALSSWLSSLGIKDESALLDDMRHPGPSRKSDKENFASTSAGLTTHASQAHEMDKKSPDKALVISPPILSTHPVCVVDVEGLDPALHLGQIKRESIEAKFTQALVKTPPQPISASPAADERPYIIDLTSSPITDGPSASTGPHNHEAMPAESPIFKQVARTPGRRRRVILDSDDEDAQVSPCFVSSASRVLETPTSSSHASLPDSRRSSPTSPNAFRPPAKAKRPQGHRFIADAALDDGSTDEEEADDSLGSLADFIVDDDVVEFATDSEEDETDDSLRKPEARRRTKRSPVRSRQAVLSNVIEILDSSEEDGSDVDVEGGQDIIRYTAPPRPKVRLPDLSDLTIDDSPPRLAPLPTKTSGRNWADERDRIAQRLFSELDKKVFDMRLGLEGARATIEWNNRLLKTAGQAHKKRERRPDGSQVVTYRITLSEKVLTGEEQILSTVAHEMCHLATWIISDDHKTAHGKIFKSWGRKVMRARQDIEVTTTHSYTIEYKYQWKCANEKCTAIYKRHSKSIDVEKERCGRCKSRLIPLFETKAANPFQTYLKTYMSQAKAAMPDSTHGEVMRALSKRWAETGADADHAAFWATYRL